MVKNVVYSFSKMSKDIVEAKNQTGLYYDGKNIRLITNTGVTTGAISFEKGNSKVITIPIPKINSRRNRIEFPGTTTPNKIYSIEGTVEPRCEIENEYINFDGSYKTSGTQQVIGFTINRDNIILFTTDNSGFDCIWKVNDETYAVELLYMRNLEFSTSNPIQAINNFENKSVDKIYWITGKDQVRFLNLEHKMSNGDLEELIDLPKDVISMVGTYNLSQPKIVDIQSGGTYTSGMVQYAYNLYRVNGSQTKASPVSELIALDKGDDLGGGDINEQVGSIPIVEIKDIDFNYTHIKVYAIKYNSYNQIPEINIIEDIEIPSNREVTVYDNGAVIYTSTVEEFTFLGSDIIIPKNIMSKDNRLFIANYDQKNFRLNLDMKAYSFDNNIPNQKAIIYDNVKLVDGNPSYDEQKTISPGLYDEVPLKFDSVNLDFDKYRYQSDGITEGGEGKYIKYELYQTTDINESYRYFKDNEIYRIGIVFYNKYSQQTLPYWIADFKSREGNLEGKYNQLKVELKPEFYTWLNTNTFASSEDKPVGYKIILAERTEKDKTILASGMLSPMMINDKTGNHDINDSMPYDEYIEYLIPRSNTLPKLPNFFTRNINKNTYFGITKPLATCLHFGQMSDVRGDDYVDGVSTNFMSEVMRAHQDDKDTQGRFYQYNTMAQLYSPELIFDNSITMSSGLKLKIKGAYKNVYNAFWGKAIDLESNTVKREVKSYQGLGEGFYEKKDVLIKEFGEAIGAWGLISNIHLGRVEFTQFYRGYGNVEVEDDFTISTVSNISVPLTATSGVEPKNFPQPAVYSPTDTLRNKDLLGAIVEGSRIKVTIQYNSSYWSSGYYNQKYQAAEITYEVVPSVDNLGVYSASLKSDKQNGYTYDEDLSVPALTTTTLNTIMSDGLYTYNADKYGEVVSNWFYLDITGEPGDTFTVNITIRLYRNNNGTTEGVEENGVVYESDGNIISIPGDVNDYTPNKSFLKSTNNVLLDLYGTPEVTSLGQEQKTYNNDSRFKYINNFKGVLTDKASNLQDKSGTYGRAVISVNSDNNRCITFVLNDNTDNYNDSTVVTRTTLEDVFDMTGLGGDDNLMIGELVRPSNDIYFGNLYGGNKWEDKHRTNYIEIGDYKDLNDLSTELYIKSPGDTFVQNFKFTRVVRKDTNVISEAVVQYSEIVEYRTETSIDLNNRNDLSLFNWDNTFHPRKEEYTKYNKVYSQMPTLIRHRDLGYNIKELDSFDTSIIATKVKNPGEIIDSWTDISPNDVLALDGKYGPINSLELLQDNAYAFQDKAVSFISINPRVQIQGDDTINIELGSGQVLQENKYISTNSGSINKWGVLSTENGIFYLDALNKTFNILDGQKVISLSDSEGFHKFFLDNTNISVLRQDNPVLNKGVSLGWNKVSNDVYLTLLGYNDNQNLTLCYNIAQKGFSSFYDYNSPMYIYTKGKMLTIDVSNNNTLWECFAGEYNMFYNTNKKSSIDFVVNPEPQIECTVNNIEYKSEAKMDRFDEPEVQDYTWERIRAYNEFQDSNLTNLTPRINIRKTNRKWRLNVPRDNNKTHRMRNTWTILHLESNNVNKYNFRTNDIVVYYNPNYKIIE